MNRPFAPGSPELLEAQRVSHANGIESLGPPTIPEAQRQEIGEALLAIQNGLAMPLAAIDSRSGQQVNVVAILLPDGSMAPVFQILDRDASSYITLPGLTEATA